LSTHATTAAPPPQGQRVVVLHAVDVAQRPFAPHLSARGKRQVRGDSHSDEAVHSPPSATVPKGRESNDSESLDEHAAMAVAAKKAERRRTRVFTARPY
jgi:hypothetical protein